MQTIGWIGYGQENWRTTVRFTAGTRGFSLFKSFQNVSGLIQTSIQWVPRFSSENKDAGALKWPIPPNAESKDGWSKLPLPPHSFMACIKTISHFKREVELCNKIYIFQRYLDVIKCLLSVRQQPNSVQVSCLAVLCNRGPLCSQRIQYTQKEERCYLSIQSPTVHLPFLFVGVIRITDWIYTKEIYIELPA